MTHSAHHPAFELLDTRPLTGLGIDVMTYKHKDTGLIHYHLACDNSENALMIGFATQPMSSRGEAHILEHVVLCGSQKYPVRDPFFSMIKRSLQTFMNAMTASDWTVYPFATQNKKDYFNLLDVYLDAVFFPNIHPLDFAQEGIRLELDDNGQPHYHGIVFNEMKGAMSGEIDQLYYALTPHLFGVDSTYHYNSGGDPKHITDMTHQTLLDFHQTYYHPSNAIVMSFGDIDVADTQTALQSFLAKFDDKDRPTQAKRFFVHPQTRLTAPISAYDTYTSDSQEPNTTHHVIAWLLPAITDPKMRLAMRLLEGVLVEHSGLPLRQYLETTPLGQAPSPLLGLDDSHFEMVFYAGLRGSEIGHADEFEQQVLALLDDIASRPIDTDTIDTILHQMELDQRHIGGDSMPYGLTLMLEGFSTAIHGGNPVDIWQVDEHLAWLKDKLNDPMWLSTLIKTHLVDNPHRVRLTLSPDDKKADALIQEEQAKLDAIAKTLSNSDKIALNKATQALQERQAMIDDIELLPKVGLDDIAPDVAFVQGERQNIIIDGKECPLYQYTIGTNGLYYYQLLMHIDDDKLIRHPLMPIYLTLLSELGTDKFSSRDFQAHQARHGSGVTARISQRSDLYDKDRLNSYFVLATRALNSKPSAIHVLKEVLTDTVFDDIERTKELLKQRQMSWQARLANSGHAYAMQTASRSMNLSSALEYSYAGLPALQALKDFLAKADDHDDVWHNLASALSRLHAQLQTLPKSVILISESAIQDTLKDTITQSLSHLPQKPTTADIIIDDFAKLETTLQDCLSPSVPKDIAWLISTNVFFNAISYPAVPSGHADAPALMVLANYLRNGYLHTAIREKGGAYGGGASFDGNGACFKFYSYRDPHCQATFEHFTQSVSWLINDPQEPRQLQEAILGIIAGMDKPGSPAGDAVKCCLGEHFHGRDKAWQEKLRADILAVSLDDLRRVATTYLLDKPFVRATLAPLTQESLVAQLGFESYRLG